MNASYPELCALHDKLYFGKWRKMEADPSEIKRAYARIDHLLSKIQERKGKPHSPAVYESHYDIIHPFKEDL